MSQIKLRPNSNCYRENTRLRTFPQIREFRVTGLILLGLLSRRLKAKPALTADGKPTCDMIQASIDWHMPPPDMMNRLMGPGG